jgi:hypothetical protein
MNNVFWFAPNSRKPRFSAVCHQSEEPFGSCSLALLLVTAYSTIRKKVPAHNTTITEIPIRKYFTSHRSALTRISTGT